MSKLSEEFRKLKDPGYLEIHDIQDFVLPNYDTILLALTAYELGAKKELAMRERAADVAKHIAIQSTLVPDRHDTLALVSDTTLEVATQIESEIRRLPVLGE